MNHTHRLRPLLKFLCLYCGNGRLTILSKIVINKIPKSYKVKCKDCEKESIIENDSSPKI